MATTSPVGRVSRRQTEVPLQKAVGGGDRRSEAPTTELHLRLSSRVEDTGTLQSWTTVASLSEDRRAKTGRGSGGALRSHPHRHIALPQQFLVKAIGFMREVRNDVLTGGQNHVRAPTNQNAADGPPRR